MLALQRSLNRYARVPVIVGKHNFKVARRLLADDKDTEVIPLTRTKATSLFRLYGQTASICCPQQSHAGDTAGCVLLVPQPGIFLPGRGQPTSTARPDLERRLRSGRYRYWEPSILQTKFFRSKSSGKRRAKHYGPLLHAIQMRREEKVTLEKKKEES